MNKLLPILSFALGTLFVSCNHSTDYKAERLFSKVFAYMQNGADTKVDLKHHEIIYSAPNDSLSVIEFTSSIAGIGTETMYFAYVVADDGDDYWVMLMNNPLDNAKEFNNNLLNSILKSPNKNKIDENLLYSAIRLNCSMKFYDGGGKRVKDTEKMIEEK